MTSYQKWALFLLRLSLGWLFFYAGITKIINPEWSAAGYLNNAAMFSGFYKWLASPGMLPITNFANEWGLTLIGVCLILGIGVRYTSMFGAAMMVLYYLPLGFPYPNEHSLVVDEHIVYAAAFLVLGSLDAGRVMSLQGKIPGLRWLK